VSRSGTGGLVLALLPGDRLSTAPDSFRALDLDKTSRPAKGMWPQEARHFAAWLNQAAAEKNSAMFRLPTSEDLDLFYRSRFTGRGHDNPVIAWTTESGSRRQPTEMGKHTEPFSSCASSAAGQGHHTILLTTTDTLLHRRVTQDVAHASKLAKSPFNSRLRGVLMLEDVATLAMAGATTVVAAMATDAWATTRARVTRLFRHSNQIQQAAVEEQLDKHTVLVVNSDDAKETRELLVPVWGQQLSALLRESPGTAEELRLIVDEIRRELPTEQRIWKQENIARDNGQVFASLGGNVIVHQGPPESQAQDQPNLGEKSTEDHT
jgi:hypothetical protein